MKLDNRPIGIFDSGLGGLTVVGALRGSLPHENIIYLGDTARVPYGDKSPANIIKFSCESAAFLAKQGVKLIVVACNTVSSIAMERLRTKFADVPVLGVLEAGVEACLAENPSRVTIIGTNATVRSDAYRREIHARNPQIGVSSVPCPLFVPIVEDGLAASQICEMAVRHYLEPYMTPPPEILLLACTHYPLLKGALLKCLPPGIKIIDSAEACAKFAERFLAQNGLSASDKLTGTERYFVTDMPSAFLKQARRFLGRDLENFEKISLGE